jgi:hypothetical protein
MFDNLDYNQYAKMRQKGLERQAQQLQQKQAALQAAQNKPKKSTLEEALGGLVTGVGERLSDIWNTAKNVVKTGAGLINQIGANDSVDNTMKDDSKRRNDIAKKYGFNSYTEAINSNKVGDDFWNEIKGSNKQTQDTLKAKTDSYRNNLSDVTKINTKEAMGQALNTYDTLLGALPLGGAYNALANAGGGVLSGIGDELKAAGREGRDFNWNQAKNNAIVGAGSGLAGAAGSALAGKAAAKAGGNALGKLLGSNVARGAAGGAAAGATGGALGAALNGGTLEDALLAAKEGAKAGGIGGGAMAGAMGLGGKALERFGNGKNGKATTIDTSEPVDAQIVQKNRIEAPNQRQLASTVEAVEPISTRRGIAITDLDAGEQPVNVRNAKQTASRGKYIDGIVRGENLPEAELPKPLTVEQRYQRGMGDANILDSVSRGQFSDEFGYQNLMDNLPKELQERVKAATADGALENNPYAGFNTKYEIRKQSDLPTLDRQQYYNDVTGNLKRGGGVLTSEDIPEYMQSHLRDGGGRNNDVLLNELFGDDMDLRDQYEQYQQMAQVRQPKTYTTENMAYGLNMDSNLANDITEYLANEYGPKAKEPTKINIEKALAQIQDVPVESLATNYRKSTIPARQYNEQAIQNMPEAEIATRPTAAVMEAPEQRVATQEPQIDYNTQLQRQKAQIAADKAKKQAISGVLEQYGTTRLSDRIEGLPTAIDDMLSLGLTDRAEIELFSKKLASGDSELAKAIRTSLNDAAPIDGKWGFTWEQVFDSAGAASNEAAQKQIKSFYESQAKRLLRADKNGQYNRNDVYDFGKALEKEGYKKYDRGVRNQNTNTQVYGEALINMSQDIISKATDGVDVSGKFDANKLKNLLPGNKTWADRVDDLSANAKTVQDLRSAMASPTKMNLLKEAEEYNLNTYGQNVGGKGKGGAAVKAGKALITGKPIQAAEAGAEIVLGSDKAKQKAIKKSYENYKKFQAQANGETPIKTGKLAGAKDKLANIKNAGIVQGTKNLVGKAGNALAGATESLNNDYLAGINGIRVGKKRTPIEFDALGNQAGKFANKQLGSTTANAAQDRLESARTLANAQADYDNALADYQASEAQTNALTQQMQQSQSQLGRIEQAMQLALNAGDITAYSQLADLYKQAAEIEELKNPTKTTSTKALSANQAKALTAQQQLDTLSQMTPDAGTVASNIPILSGIVNLTGGNEYANQASSLATTLGYLLSGANIKESEAQRIGQAYVPTAFDSEAVRKQKLERARQLIQSYMSDTGAIEQ